MAVFFIVGEMAGTGIVNLPQAISQTGWIGCGFLILCACMASFTGTKLGKIGNIYHRPWARIFFQANVGTLSFKRNHDIKKKILPLIQQ